MAPHEKAWQKAVLNFPFLALALLTLSVGMFTYVANQKEANVLNSRAASNPTPFPSQAACAVTSGQYTLTTSAVGTVQGVYTCSNSAKKALALSFATPLTFVVDIPKPDESIGQRIATKPQTTTLAQLCLGRAKQCAVLCQTLNCSATVVTYHAEGIYFCSPHYNNELAAEGTAYLEFTLAVRNGSGSCAGTASMQAPVAGTLISSPQ